MEIRYIPDYERGTIYGCGKSLIELGQGVIDIAGIYRKLESVGFDGHITLEIAGEDTVVGSYNYLKELGAE